MLFNSQAYARLAAFLRQIVIYLHRLLKSKFLAKYLYYFTYLRIIFPILFYFYNKITFYLTCLLCYSIIKYRINSGDTVSNGQFQRQHRSDKRSRGHHYPQVAVL